ncbi:hypothetical protein BMS3Abin03_00992 [bacterium BMS3Abin03]|nr:hypothetical protein BMS3Abin03_00992 [bacterium BMS3Abin03]
MALRKKYSANKKNCRVTFTLPKEIGANFEELSVVGDFNNWDSHANRMTENEPDGSYSTTIDLKAGKEYQFKYLLDGNQWLNEPEADKRVDTYISNSKNSMIKV